MILTPPVVIGDDTPMIVCPMMIYQKLPVIAVSMRVQAPIKIMMEQMKSTVRKDQVLYIWVATMKAGRNSRADVLFAMFDSNVLIP